ncbi:hypothetical protein PPERSA_01482 [Pseudocohnilembus persalinus]|uniref:Leucine Rich Repeat family protein n=1 Tax=Pseudocohnilembus persalinus TaxID=266149 RepID=A0A0V0QHD4_PSEPJ|nr:hypothetical protein PPERSA_01482 [Pseudocohnilembus persalinus]|eukprot:KRX01579.1 hypothetical protein PPERSA_01482 [Pseudocohnilembus persalinus]
MRTFSTVRQEFPDYQPINSRTMGPNNNFQTMSQQHLNLSQQQQQQQFESPYSMSYFQQKNPQYMTQGPMNQVVTSASANRLPGVSMRGQDDSLIKIMEKQALQSRINLQEMYINDEGAEKLAQILVKYKNINYIELKGNNISGQGFVPIFEALKSNFQIRVLGLQWNRLGGADLTGLESLYSLLQTNKNITHLDLRNNRINQNGAHIIANIIRHNNTLSSLDLRWNEISNIGAQAILAALENNYSLVSLELAGNSVQEQILQQIQQVTIQNREGNQRNMRRILLPQQQNENEWNRSLNDRDLEFRSRDPAFNESRPGNPLYNTSSYFDRQIQKQNQNAENANRTLPYEQQRILQHLEALIEDERIKSLQLKENLSRQINEKKSLIDMHQARQQELQENLGEIENTNKILKNDLRDIEQDLKSFEQQKKSDLEKISIQNQKLEAQIREKDQIQTEEIKSFAEKYTLNLKTTEQEYEIQLEDLRQKYHNLKSQIDDNRMAIHKANDDLLQRDLDNKEKAKEMVEKIKDDSRRTYKLKADYLQNRLNRMHEGKLNTERKVEGYLKDRVLKQKDFAEKLKDIEIQSVKRKLNFRHSRI